VPQPKNSVNCLRNPVNSVKKMPRSQERFPFFRGKSPHFSPQSSARKLFLPLKTLFFTRILASFLHVLQHFGAFLVKNSASFGKKRRFFDKFWDVENHDFTSENEGGISWGQKIMQKKFKNLLTPAPDLIGCPSRKSGEMVQFETSSPTAELI